MIPLLALVLVAGLAAVHLFSGRMRFVDVSPRSRWLSAAGGVSAAYAFVHLLADLAEGQETVRDAVGGNFTFLEHHARLVALVGLFYEVSGAAPAVLFAFLAGGVVTNVPKEELPEERESRFWAFVLGAGLYAAILLAAF